MANRYVGGDITEITFNHPTLGNFNFATKSNESYTLDPGGVRGDDDSDMVTGSGANIRKLNNKRWSFEGPLVADFASNLEIKNLPLISGDPEEGTITISHIGGAIWRGQGSFVGEISIDTNTSQFSAKFAGGGILELLN